MFKLWALACYSVTDRMILPWDGNLQAENEIEIHDQKNTKSMNYTKFGQEKIWNIIPWINIGDVGANAPCQLMVSSDSLTD